MASGQQHGAVPNSGVDEDATTENFLMHGYKVTVRRQSNGERAFRKLANLDFPGLGARSKPR